MKEEEEEVEKLFESQQRRLENLPYEVLFQILNYLPDGKDLARCAQTSSRLRRLILGDDKLWKNLCEEDVGITSCKPYETFYELYSKLYHHLWMRGAVWFGDKENFGTLVVSRFSSSSGKFEVYEVLLERVATEEIRNLTANSMVVIPTFAPSISFGNQPIVKLGPEAHYDDEHSLTCVNKDRYVYTCLVPVSTLPVERVHPSMNVWPPHIIPSTNRTRSSASTNCPTAQLAAGQTSLHYNHTDESPAISSSASSISSTASSSSSSHYQAYSRLAGKSLDGFRLRKWVSFSAMAVAMGDTVETFSRLSPNLITPTENFPWRGLWLGDYSAHGGEFLLFHQPSSERLEAIKLTGDVNVPRGEYSFIAEDLHHALPVTYSEWPHSPVVDSRCQVAQFHFINSHYTESQLILISKDIVAHYIVSLDRVSFIYRVDPALLIRGDPGRSSIPAFNT